MDQSRLFVWLSEQRKWKSIVSGLNGLTEITHNHARAHINGQRGTIYLTLYVPCNSTNSTNLQLFQKLNILVQVSNGWQWHDVIQVYTTVMFFYNQCSLSNNPQKKLFLNGLQFSSPYNYLNYVIFGTPSQSIGLFWGVHCIGVRCR